VVKKQFKTSPFKPLVPIKAEALIKTEVSVKTEAYSPPRNTKKELQIKSEQTVAGAVQATVKKEVTIKSAVDEELRSSPIIDKFHDLSTVSPKKESSPLKRKISLGSGVEHGAVVKSEARAIKKAKK